MADLTSTITITGTINGRKISFSHTYTMEDVYDAGTRLCGQALNESNVLANEANAGTIGWLQDTPNFIALRNSNTQYWEKFILNTASPGIGLCLAPGQTAILNGTTGVGNLSNGTGSTTLRDVTEITTTTYTGQAHANPSVFVAFNAVS